MSTEPDKQETLLELDVPPGYAEDGRLDVYLTRFLPNVSRTKVQRGIKEGQVQVNGAVVTKVSHTVQPGDHIECRVLRPPPMEVIAEDIPVDILYEDEHLIIVNKAAGMVVHPAYGHRTGTLVNALLHHVGGGALSVEEDEEELDDDDVGLSTVNAAPHQPGAPTVRPGIVHRLDKDTTGVMVVAKDDVTHVGLARQFEQRTIHRRYHALVWGVPKEDEGRVETHLGRDPRDRKRMAVVPEDRGKHAITHFTVLERLAHAALLQFRLETGRTHQIRVHARHIGHPILGDPTYAGQSLQAGPGGSPRRAFFRKLFEVMPRQALHAFSLGFVHPQTGERLHFEAPLPADMQHVLDEVRRVEGGA